MLQGLNDQSEAEEHQPQGQDANQGHAPEAL
jgi:hypothetical protein